ncbi:MAG TPA: hypothetical protein VFE17_05590 [Candidatus Baltobacteraceae bacterium]|nr:hypothetical protein [Candidatus Baltobacteraceae bacterium]
MFDTGLIDALFYPKIVVKITRTRERDMAIILQFPRAPISRDVPACELTSVLPDDHLFAVHSEPDRTLYEWACGCAAQRRADSALCDVVWCWGHRTRRTGT